MSLIDILADDLSISPAEIVSLSASAPHRYKIFRIPKRRPGQFRTIAQPTPEIKIIQSAIVRHLSPNFPIHTCATAYRSGKNITDNVRPHLYGNYLLKMDFSDFFHSIVPPDFIRHWQRHHKSRTLDVNINIICRFLFWHDKAEKQLRLSIGAPSSPWLSNTLLFDFDSAVAKIAADHQVVYTRYADDLTFTGKTKESLKLIENGVYDVASSLTYPRLSIKREKTIFASKATQRRVTGLTITNDGRVSLGRDRKRLIRAQVHHLLNKLPTDCSPESLAGTLAFAKSIEPSFIISLEKKYGKNLIKTIRNVYGRHESESDLDA